MLPVTLVSVIKDKTGKVGSLDNYRPIALASVLSKALEHNLIDSVDYFLFTWNSQFGLKPKQHRFLHLCFNRDGRNVSSFLSLKANYLGYMIPDRLLDDDDMNKQCV